MVKFAITKINRGRERLSFKILVMQPSLVFTISLYIHQLSTKPNKLQLTFHILKAACCLAGFGFHLQVWDWLALEGKLHFGGHTEAGVPEPRLK